SGKSTFVEKLQESNPGIEFDVFNTDLFVKFLYGDLSVEELESVWDTSRRYILQKYSNYMVSSIHQRRNIIIDQVNYKRYNRKINLDRFINRNYLKICIEMVISPEEIASRMELRRQENKRIVANNIMTQYTYDY